MFKKTTTLTIDDELIKNAKANFINISEVAENALRERLKIKEVEIDETQVNCGFCGIEMKHSEPDNLNGLVWLYPDEKWICPNCLKVKGKSFVAGVNF